MSSLQPVLAKALATEAGAALLTDAGKALFSGLVGIAAGCPGLDARLDALLRAIAAIEAQAAQAERERLEVAVKSLTVYRGLRKRIVLDLADVLSVFVIEGKEPK